MFTRIIKFFSGESALRNFIERNNPKNIKDIDNLCKMWIEQQQNKII